MSFIFCHNCSNVIWQARFRGADEVFKISRTWSRFDLYLDAVGEHRGLGPSISKVRSLKMDKKIWTEELIQVNKLKIITSLVETSLCCKFMSLSVIHWGWSQLSTLQIIWWTLNTYFLRKSPISLDSSLEQGAQLQSFRATFLQLEVCWRSDAS